MIGLVGCDGEQSNNWRENNKYLLVVFGGTKTSQFRDTYIIDCEELFDI
jgi:hypothetical protein